METDPLRRDVAWRWSTQLAAHSDRALLPQRSECSLRRRYRPQETRTAITVNPRSTALGQVPGRGGPGLNEALARAARRCISITRTTPPTLPRDAPPDSGEGYRAGAGVFHRRASSTTRSCRAAQGITVLEAPVDEIRATAVINWIKTTFPDKFIAYVVPATITSITRWAENLRGAWANIVMARSRETFFDVSSPPPVTRPMRSPIIL